VSPLPGSLFPVMRSGSPHPPRGWSGKPGMEWLGRGSSRLGSLTMPEGRSGDEATRSKTRLTMPRGLLSSLLRISKMGGAEPALTDHGIIERVGGGITKIEGDNPPPSLSCRPSPRSASSPLTAQRRSGEGRARGAGHTRASPSGYMEIHDTIDRIRPEVCPATAVHWRKSVLGPIDILKLLTSSLHFEPIVQRARLQSCLPPPRTG
jgi:hypothetical protein